MTRLRSDRSLSTRFIPIYFMKTPVLLSLLLTCGALRLAAAPETPPTDVVLLDL